MAPPLAGLCVVPVRGESRDVNRCDVYAAVGCMDAYLSPYASLFGISVAFLGLCWFAEMCPSAT